MDPRCLETEANEILTAIVHGMRRDEPSNHVKLSATNALLRQCTKEVGLGSAAS